MKKLLLNLLIVFCSVSAFGQYNFTLDISSHTLPEKKLYLYIFNNRNHFIPLSKDSVLFKNGHITITGQMTQPSSLAGLYLAVGKYFTTNFVIDSGINHISLELPVGKAKILTLKSDTKGCRIYDEMNQIFNDDADHYPKPTRVNGYLKIPEDLQEQIIQHQLTRLESYPNDFGSLVYLYIISRLNDWPDDAKKILATLATFNDSLRNSALGKQLYTEKTDLINNKIIARAGNKALIFNVRDVNNQPFSNSSLVGQNYMIVFSATWCGPCQLELPKLKKLYQTYKEKGFKIIYFNNDDNVRRWKEHVAANKLNWINVSERLKPSQSKIQNSFGVYSIPTCLIVNKKGMIIYNSDETDPGLDRIESYIKKVIYN